MINLLEEIQQIIDKIEPKDEELNKIYPSAFIKILFTDTIPKIFLLLISYIKQEVDNSSSLLGKLIKSNSETSDSKNLEQDKLLSDYKKKIDELEKTVSNLKTSDVKNTKARKGFVDMYHKANADDEFYDDVI